MSAQEGTGARWQVRRDLDPCLEVESSVFPVPEGANPVDFARELAEQYARDLETETWGEWTITQPSADVLLLAWTWPNGATDPQTDRFVLEAALSCPTTPFTRDGQPHTIVGCGSTNLSRDDAEPNLYDCLDCGIWFDPSREVGQ